MDRVAEGEERLGAATFPAGAVKERFTPTLPHQPTAELIGRRRGVHLTAPPSATTHLPQRELLTWHCLLALRKAWPTRPLPLLQAGERPPPLRLREKIVPTLGAVVWTRLMRTVGKIFGYQGWPIRQAVNFPVGAHARCFNVTRRDDGQPREPEQ